jgi:hypothetical protein
VTQITKQEFDDLYGDVEVEFTSYYKYSFTFAGDAPDGTRIALSIGGCADEIYRLDVSAGVKVKVREFWASYAGAYFGEDGEDPIHFYSEY